MSLRGMDFRVPMPHEIVCERNKADDVTFIISDVLFTLQFENN